MPAIRKINVWPNPFGHVDAEGRPCGLLPVEPVGSVSNPSDSLRFVGAQLRAKVLVKAPPGSRQQSVQDTTVEYADEPTALHLTDYYRDALRRREIIPADEATAKLAKVPFLEPAKFFVTARAEKLTHQKDVLLHDDHEDDDEIHTPLESFHFGPMPEAVEARAKKAAEAKAAAKPDKVQKPAPGNDDSKGGAK